MTVADMRRMEIGQVVDYCKEWNAMHKVDEKKNGEKKKPMRRKATQADWDAFLG